MQNKQIKIKRKTGQHEINTEWHVWFKDPV